MDVKAPFLRTLSFKNMFPPDEIGLNITSLIYSMLQLAKNFVCCSFIFIPPPPHPPKKKRKKEKEKKEVFFDMKGDVLPSWYHEICSNFTC